MHPLIKEAKEQLENLDLKFREILDLGDRIVLSEDDEVEEILDIRLLLLNRTEELTFTARSLIVAIREMSEIPPQEKAFIEEVRSRIFDLAPRIVHQSKFVVGHMEGRMAKIRQQLIMQNKTSQAVGSYLRAPMARSSFL